MKYISIITPLYNGEKFISGLVQNIKNNYKNMSCSFDDVKFEYIFVNDNPNDKIDISRFSTNLIEIKLLNNSKNSGIQKSRVKGLVEAKGDFILFLDQDDRIDDDFIVSQYKNISDYDMIVANGYKEYPEKLKVLYKTIFTQYLVEIPQMYIYGTDMILSPGQCLIKKSSIPKEWYEYILTNNGCDDYFLWLLMLSKKAKFKINTKCFFYHRETDENYSASSSKMILSLNEMVDILENKNLIKSKFIKVLRRRIMIKKKNMSNRKKAYIELIKNIDIFLFTMVYKFLGFY